MFSPTRWIHLSHLFISTHHTLLSIPTRPLLHIALSAGLSALKTPACHSASTSSHTSTVCPICSTELNDLAKNVPYAHHTKSIVENDPIVLPNGRVYGRERLKELQRKAMMAAGLGANETDDLEGTLVDPTTGEKFTWNEVRKVYIT